MPPLGGPGPRRVDTAAYRRRQRNLRRTEKAARKAPVPSGPPSFPRYVPPRPGATPPRRPTAHPPSQVAQARAQERAYKSLGKAVEHHATTDPALREIERYVQKTPHQKRQQLAQIKAKPKADWTLGEWNIDRLHRGRHAADVKMIKDVGFLPRERYGYTPKLTKYNVMPVSGDRYAKAGELASPQLRAALATNPKLRKQLITGIKTKGISAAVESLQTAKAQREATNLSPALKVLEQTLRPVHGVAGAAHAGLTGKNIVTGAKRGVLLKDRVLFSDVLGDLGMPKGWARSALGTTLDIGLDPTTYVSFGVGSVARKGAMKLAEETAAKAARQQVKALSGRVVAGELTKREAKEIARRRGRDAYLKTFEGEMKRRAEQAPKSLARGVDVRITGGRTARRVGRAIKGKTGVGTRGVLAPATRLSAAQGRAVGKLAEPLARSPVGRALRKEARDVGQAFAPVRAGRTGAQGEHLGAASKTEHALTKGLQRERRAEADRELRFFHSRARSLLNRLTPEEEQRVIDVLESRAAPGRVQARRVLKRTIGESGRLPLRNILTSGQRRLLPNLNPAEIGRRLKTSRDPRRLLRIANQLESDLSYAERIGTRSGALSSRIGARSLTPGELTLATAAQRAPRNVASLQRELEKTRTDMREARLRQQAASTPLQKKAADLNFERVSQRSGNLNQRLRSTRKAQVAQGRAQREFKQTRRERFHGVEVPEVSADVAGAQGRLAAVRGAAEQTVKPEARGKFIAAHGEHDPGIASKVSDLTVGLEKKGQPGTRVEIDRDTGNPIAVHRDAKGQPVGAVALWDGVLEAAVEKTHQGRGLGSELVATLQREGGFSPKQLEDAARAGGFTQQGAALAHRLLTGRHAEAGAKVGQAQRRLVQVRQVEHRQRAARATALARQREIGPPEAAGYFPRVRSEKGKELDELAAELGPTLEPPTKESEGVRRPTGGPLTRREHRQTRAALRQTAPDVLERTEPGILPTMATYGAALTRRVSQANLNRRLFAEAGRRLPRTLGPNQMRALEQGGFNVYHLERGGLQPLSWSRDRNEILRAARGATAHGGQYKVLPNQLVKDVYKRGTAPSNEQLLRRTRQATAGWKGFALKTPSYLVRNFFGDLYNAWGHEGALRTLSNTAQGQQALRAMNRYEKALRTFERDLPKDKRSIVLTKNQRDEISQALGYDIGEKIPARQVGLLAEKMGVVRQGRHVEVQDTRALGLPKARRTGGWETTAKHVEDSARMGTFLGGLHRGMSPREAAQRASDIHFDYGDLSSFERGLREIFPFYTFTARNVPLQAKMLLTRPSRAASVQKTREEGRRYARMQPGFEKGLDPYEALQLGVPYLFGDPKDKNKARRGTASLGSPFVDLSVAGALLDSVTSGKPDALVSELFRRGGGMLHPAKLAAELPANYSLFYRDKIKRASQGPRELAPDWAVKRAAQVPGFRAMTGLRDDYIDKETGNRGWGWSRKWGYFFRAALPGPAGAVARAPGLNVPSKNARGMTSAEQALSIFGVRSKEYKSNQAELNAKFREAERVQTRLDDLNDTAHPTDRRPNGQPYTITAEHPTPEYLRLSQRRKLLQRRIKALQTHTRAYVSGRPVGESSGGGGGLELGIDTGSDLGLDLKDLGLE